MSSAITDFGLSGFLKIDDTDMHEGRFYAIVAIDDDAVLTTCTAEVGSNLDGNTISKGLYIYGPFTDIQRTSGGIVLAYLYPADHVFPSEGPSFGS